MFIGANGIFRLSSLKRGFFKFPLLIINEGEICGVRSSKRFNWKMSVQVSITFSNLGLTVCFVVIGLEG